MAHPGQLQRIAYKIPAANLVISFPLFIVSWVVRIGHYWLLKLNLLEKRLDDPLSQRAALTARHRI
jgi:hypothetical protein